MVAVSADFGCSPDEESPISGTRPLSCVSPLTRGDGGEGLWWLGGGGGVMWGEGEGDLVAPPV